MAGQAVESQATQEKQVMATRSLPASARNWCQGPASSNAFWGDYAKHLRRSQHTHSRCTLWPLQSSF